MTAVACTAGHGREAEQVQAHPGEKQGGGHDHHDDHAGAEVVSGQDQSDDAQPAIGHHRDDGVLPAVQQLRLLGQHRGHPQGQGKLGRLGRLQGEEPADFDPVLVAVDAGADDQHQPQQAVGDDDARPREALQPHHVDPRQHEHQEDADAREQPLFEGGRVGRLPRRDGLHAGRREHHHDADGGQGQGGAEDEVVGGAVARLAASLKGGPEAPVPPRSSLAGQREPSAARCLDGSTRPGRLRRPLPGGRGTCGRADHSYSLPVWACPSTSSRTASMKASPR